jgi:hypothetical protein
LKNIKLEYIDNGDFKKNVIKSQQNILELAKKARSLEGENTDQAFERWITVYSECQNFTDEYYISEKVEWADITYKKEKFLKALGKGFLWLLSVILSALFGAFFSTIFH